MASELCMTFTEQNFDEEVLQSKDVVLVDFWATWCGPCRMVSPVIDELASDFAGKAKVGKVNVDEQPALAQKYRVMTIPTVAVFKNGELVDKKIGAFPKSEFAKMLQAALA